MHGHQVGRIAGRELGRQLIVARPGGDVDLQPDVRVLALELVQQAGDDLALAVGIARPGPGRAALAEDPLDGDLGDVGLLGAAEQAERGDGREGEVGQALHRTAAPDTARTMYFWKKT
ncbi:hypothetical protein D3C87_1742820 [compost metagenome]